MLQARVTPEDVAAFAEERKQMSLRYDAFKKLVRNAFAAFAVEEAGGYSVERDAMRVFDVRDHPGESAPSSPKIPFELATYTAPGCVNPLNATWVNYCAAKRVEDLAEAFNDDGKTLRLA